MDRTRHYGMQTIARQGQCGEGIELHRKMTVIAEGQEGKDYAIGLMVDCRHNGHDLRGNIGAEKFVEVVHQCEIASKYRIDDLVEKRESLRELADELVDKWKELVNEHYASHPLEDIEKSQLSEEEMAFIQNNPQYLYRCMATMVIENANGAALIHSGDFHPVFISASGSCPMMHPQPRHYQDGHADDVSSHILYESIPLSRARVVAIVSDSLYRAMPIDYLSSIHQLLGYYPELAEEYIESQMPLLSAKVANEDLGIVVLFDQDPIAHKSNYVKE